MPGTFYHLDSLALAVVVDGAVTWLCMALVLFRLAEELRPTLRAWLLGAALLVGADIIFFLDFLPAVVGRAIPGVAALGLAEWIHALRLYNGHRRRIAWPYVVSLLGGIATTTATSYPVIALATSVTLGVLYVGLLVTAAGIREPPRAMGRRLLLAVFGALAAVMVIRIGLFLAGTRSGAPPGFTSPGRALLFVLAALGPVGGSFAFLLTCGELLGHRLRQQSRTDPLTGVANRRAFFEAVERALAAQRRHGQPFSVLLIDVDHFKAVNDDAGHPTGDAVLVRVVDRLRAGSRIEDTVARLGGEEFGVVLPGVTLEHALPVAERLRGAVAATPVRIDEREFWLTISVGVAPATRAESADALLARLDALLYEAKRAGRNRVQGALPLPVAETSEA